MHRHYRRNFCRQHHPDPVRGFPQSPMPAWHAWQTSSMAVLQHSSASPPSIGSIADGTVDDSKSQKSNIENLYSVAFFGCHLGAGNVHRIRPYVGMLIWAQSALGALETVSAPDPKPPLVSNRRLTVC